MQKEGNIVGNLSYDRAFYEEQQDSSLTSARVILGMAFRFFPKVRSVLDVGGGVGTWLKAAIDLGAENILCIDGDYVDTSMLKINPMYFTALDIANESLDSVLVNRERQIFDLTICLEVAEHLPYERSRSLTKELTSTSDIVLFSAALPYQYGVNHINEQWAEFWALLFRSNGYSCFDFLREEIWDHPEVDWWYAQNTLVFVKDDSAAAEYIMQNIQPTARPLSRVHPKNFLTNILFLHRRYRLEASAEEQIDYSNIVHAYTSGSNIIPRLESVARAMAGAVDKGGVFPYTRTDISHPEQEIANLHSENKRLELELEQQSTKYSVLTDGLNADLNAAISENKRLELELEQQSTKYSVLTDGLNADLNAAISENKRLGLELEQQSTKYSVLTDDLNAALSEKKRLALELAAVVSSTSWKVMLPARRMGAHIPSPARKLLRRLARLTWWTLTLQLPQQLARRRRSSQLELASENIVTTGELVSVVDVYTETFSEMILVVADILPLFDQSSGGLRLKTLIDMIGETGRSMVFGSNAGLDAQPGILFSPQGRMRYEEVLRNAGVSQFLYGPEEIDRFIEKFRREIACAFFSFPKIAARFMPSIRAHCPDARVIYDMVDFHSVRLTREAKLYGDPATLVEAEKIRKIEMACAAVADITIAVTEEEKIALQVLVPDAVVEVLPNVFAVPTEAQLGPARRTGLFFIGGFWHKPNSDAVRWFVFNVFPLIKQEMPEIILSIAGANAGDEVLALGQVPGVEILGFVEDLGPLYHSNRVFVAPLRYGAGMKGKVGQSLAYGLPVVATTIGAEGMGLEDGVHLLVADDVNNFAEQVLRLLRDDELWNCLSIAGRDHILNHYSIDVVRKKLETILDG